MEDQTRQPGPSETRKTPLYELHIELGARMVPFAGYAMPVQYPTGIRAEHEHTRTRAGLFDISHMGQIRVEGPAVATALERLVPGDIEGLAPWQQRYSVLTNEQGGIIDDLMITRMPDHHFLVVNASRKQHDYAYLAGQLAGCRVTHLTDRGLLALQGPAAASVIEKYYPAVAEISFLTAAVVKLDGIECLLHRCGYTGEDGFEISVANSDLERLARLLLADPVVKPVGLGARDSLRLEAGLSLYGHELDEQTTPVQAGLAWVIAPKYRNPPTQPAYFPGADRILRELVNGPEKTLKAFKSSGKVPIRDGTIIYDGQGTKTGIITSGAWGQTVGGPIALGYVDKRPGHDDEYQVEIRNQRHRIDSVKLPFVKHRYYRKTR